MGKGSKKVLIAVIAILIICAAAIGFYVFSLLNTGFNTNKPVSIYIDEKKDYDAILTQIKDSAKVEDIDAFTKLADYRGYPDNIKTGRYIINPTDNIWDVVNRLNRGLQSPIKITFNNMRLKEDLAERLATQLMIEKDDILEVLNDPSRCAEYGLNTNTIITLFIPNTYEMYWDISADKLLARMKKEHDKFWTEDRLAKARKLDLTSEQVASLAAIVEEECMYTDEYPIVAGLYLNRLRRGQLLQADPTVKYAVGDFSIQRILYKHLEVDSPYNTYIYAGLPPSPIRIPSIKGLDAVLNYAEHNYLYMCAKEDMSGRHNFETTLSAHNRNAEKYRQALNARRIY